MSAPTPELHRLLDVITRLRAPDGCPWDREQTELSMAPHLLEEAYEAIEAIQSGSARGACEELGDVLMNVLMIARIASETDRYDVEAVARGIADKLIRRHPHVFGEAQADDAAAVLRNWEAIKETERREEGTGKQGVLSGVPAALPSLLRAFRVTEKAARVGFDWPDRSGPRAKLDEELGEFDAAVAAGDTAAVERELGDVLLSVVNVARHHGVNPEMALRATVDTFARRFSRVEQALGERLAGADLAELEEAWQAAKRQEPPSENR